MYLTIDDFPQDKANCATCTQKMRMLCEREKHKADKGTIKGPNGNISGVIYRCVNYEGKYKNPLKSVITDYDDIMKEMLIK